MRSLLTQARRVVSAAFYQFGIHCATHQIRVILICAVVITSLFYPALALYAPSKPLTTLSSHLSAYYHAGHTDASALADLQEIWHVYDGALRVRDDADSRLRCGLDTTVRLERIVLPSADMHLRANGALNPRTLGAALSLERRIDRLLKSSQDLSCVRSQQTPDDCLVLSPLLYWNRDSSVLAGDTQPVVTVNSQRNISLDGFAIPPESVLAGLTWEDSEEFDLAQAELLVLSYFFQDDVCDGSDGHAAWLKLLHRAVADLGSIRTRSQLSTMLPLQFHTSSDSSSRFSIISVFLYLTYFVVFFNFSGTMRNINTVHSRLGLVFTGFVEIIASTITSVSVLALWGYRTTLVPWGILPLIMVFVGAENMLSMVNAIGQTPVTMPVKERIALGVSHAGTSNTLKVITYNAVLGSLAVFVGHGAIRQFCVFAIVVLVAHWFLVHTLFLTVLSIDLQRLELSEVLSQDPGLSPSSLDKGRRGNAIPKRTSGTEIVQRLVKSRATKDSSLLLILAVTLILYYVTYPAQQSFEDEVDPFARHSQRTSSAAAAPTIENPAYHLWQTLNPEEKPLVHVRIEPPSLVQFTLDSQDSKATAPRATTSQSSRKTVSSERKAFSWFVKIVLLPITGTVGILYLLLVYLLKNAELLETQRGRGAAATNGHGQHGSSDEISVSGEISFSTLPRAFATDVELVAVARDGKVCAAVSSDNVLAIWPTGGQMYTTVEIAETHGLASTVALDAQGRYLCVGTGTGVLLLWRIDCLAGLAAPIGTFGDDQRKMGGVRDLGFVRHIDDSFSIVAIYDDEAVLEWDAVTGQSTNVEPSYSTDSISKAFLLHERDRDATAIAFMLMAGTIEIVDCIKGPGAWFTTSSAQIEPSHDVVIAMNRAYFNLQDSGPRQVIVTLSRSGALRLWDGQTSESILHLDNIKLSMGEAETVQLQIAGMQANMTTCERCHEQAGGGFSVALGIGESVFVYRATVGERCACSSAGNSGRSNGRRSRASSTAPPPVRTRAPPRISTPHDYPISGHGFHSRRASEKEQSRRSMVPDDAYEVEQNGDAITLSSRWKELRARCVAEVPCERGAWALVDGVRVIGVRRRAKGVVGNGVFTPSTAGAATALSTAVLQRWEAWNLYTCHASPAASSSTLYSLSIASPTAGSDLYRPSRSTSRQSSISSINAASKQPATDPSAESRFPRLPFTRISCLRSVNDSCFVGLGNTLGVLQLAPLMSLPSRLPPPSSVRTSPALSRRGSVGGLGSAFLTHGIEPPVSVL
ncbi:sterol-sensing domain of SREBP cleavage-activation-domain-containing protein [Auriculariales sp. MPI-PUGE-AT-0066]|nr:sterol-sensing domain of SREBP cleavage-activation-domain-containing protein [Auriculariales sp. MPI-PUGE-AT-0066]